MTKAKILRVNTLQPEFQQVTDGLNEGVSRFMLVKQAHAEKVTLVVGSPSVIELPGGYAICLGMTTEQIMHLREQCDVYLRMRVD